MIVMGTLPYMAPEQIRGERVDKRGDVYAFGALSFEALSGVLPREGKSIGEAPGPGSGDAARLAFLVRGRGARGS